MADPYEILGVSRTASPEEIKRAYSKLAKQYHPDLHPNDPSAEQKMKELNAAYDAIIKGTAGGETASQRQSGYSYRYNYDYDRARADDTLGAAASYINAGFYREALNVLAGVSPRTAQWFYLSAIANAGIGGRITAVEHARRAAAMEPTNAEYQRLLDNLERGSVYYTERYDTFPQMRISPFTIALFLCMLRTMCLGGGGWGFFC